MIVKMTPKEAGKKGNKDGTVIKHPRIYSQSASSSLLSTSFAYSRISFDGSSYTPATRAFTYLRLWRASRRLGWRLGGRA
jgi:hypothetical protein